MHLLLQRIDSSIGGRLCEGGNHSSFAKKIECSFDEMLKIPPPGGWAPISAKKALEDIISDIKKALDAQPGVHVDDLIF
ncbi:MAG: hypothetical protein IM534_00870 [Chitinophagaceae bacterium]|jgi:hypothetical protein|nr:hypothetical protein [Chitinophagaceae bacterium]MCA6471744.1 hypothetical protein [Chitinophagaceae bacterium]MCA6486388.1 hypothetical protein [Chitinophagaceae bacterium]MCA6489434.1 hypothetical protein [Chitinophagaceae bacterium]MCA6492234.1 hypothetical protein [Chitinophagaceae bacterium]